ncbi:MAG TPA: sensor domain-containing diguanylate cyclase [Rectinemataceae bacterium]|nr:sensor domain-containing diguanylate cyclase [Rectinemataceae bacterium]
MSENSREPDLEDLIRLSVFSSIGTSIVAEKTIRGVLNRVMEHIGTFFGPLNWSLLLVDAARSELVFKLVVGKSADALHGMRIPLGSGIAGWVASNGTPAVVEDAASDSRWSDWLDKLTGFDTRSIIAVPLRSGDKVFGVIELINRFDGRPFTAYDMRVLSTIADFTAIAIEKAYYLAEARRLSELDPLTGALNRRGLSKAIERETTRIARYGGDLSVIMADVDRFKAINDKHGHAAGDEVLKSVAQVLMQAVRHADCVARYGGDEFLVLLPATNPEEAEIARERAQKLLEKAGKAHVPPYSVTLGAHTSSEVNFDELFDESDRDLYRRKSTLLSIGQNLLEALDEESRRELGPAAGKGATP